MLKRTLKEHCTYHPKLNRKGYKLYSEYQSIYVKILGYCKDGKLSLDCNERTEKVKTDMGQADRRAIIGSKAKHRLENAMLNSRNKQGGKILEKQHYLDELLSSVIISFLLKFINFSLPLSSQPFKGFLVLPIAYKVARDSLL